MCVYTLTSCCNGIVIYIMRLVIISYKSIIRFGKVLTKKLTTQHQKTMFSSLSRSAKSPVTTIQKLSSSRRSVVDKKVFSKTPATTSPVAARRTARVVRAESGDGVVTVAEPKENGSTDDDVARGVADAVAAAEKAFEMDDATKEDDVSPSAVQQRAKAAM